MALEVLVVDDEADIRELVSGVLEDEGFAVRTAADSGGALDAIEHRRPSLVLLDVWLQGSRLDGLQLLQEVKGRDPSLPVLMISSLTQEGADVRRSRDFFFLRPRLVVRRDLSDQAQLRARFERTVNQLDFNSFTASFTNDDNRLENLRILCPNCHALTDNYRGRNIGRR